MKTRLDNRALRAQKTIDLLRNQIDSLEGWIEIRRKEIIEAIKEDDWAVAAERCNAAAEHQAEILKRWTTINELRVVVDNGTTHVEEANDFA